MARRELLCVGLGGPCVSLMTDIQSTDWDVHAVMGLGAAAKLLRENHFLVGLLFFDDVDNGICEEIDEFLRVHRALEWIGIFHANSLALPMCREIILGHMFDFHTRPIDQTHLFQTVGHAYGRAALRDEPRFQSENSREPTLIGQSASMQKLTREIKKVANTDAPVLISGESGTGKELTAQAVHKHSSRSGGPFVPLNCGAIPHSLIQSELFGHEKGAFTGANHAKRGLIESAAGGTILLDEIGDLPLDLQANLLRFLQEKTINRVGSTENIHVDLRVVAASHVNLEEAVGKGKFREDLYYRLNVLPLAVPPLRERMEDIEMLAQHFFDKFALERSPKLKGFSSHAIQAMKAHDWPGNVRELINRVRRAMAMAEGQLITSDDLNLERPTAPRPREALEDARTNAERKVISVSLERTGKNISQAARDLGVSRMTLYRLMEKHGIAH